MMSCHTLPYHTRSVMMVIIIMDDDDDAAGSGAGDLVGFIN